MKFIHIADIHASKERYENIKNVMDQLTERCRESDIEAVIVAGDFFDSTITVSDSSHYTDYLRLMNILARYTKVIFIYGTPSHENNGVLYPFSLIENVTVLAGSENNPYMPSFLEFDDFEVVGIPEARMSELQGKTVDEKSCHFKKIINEFIEKLPDKNKFRIVIGHGEIEGTSYQNGQQVAKGPFTLSVSELKKIHGDYYAWGHIHQPQKIKGLAGYYAGSVYPLNFGECHEAGYRIVEI